MNPAVILRCACAATLLGLVLALPAMAQQTSRYAVDLPPSATLDYTVRARQSGFPMEGDAQVKWTLSDDTFSLSTRMRATLVGKIIEAQTDGIINDFGLAPVSFTEKRLRRKATSVSFDRKAGTVTFNKSSNSVPLGKGTQDRNSAIWQLVAIARAAKTRFKTGSRWSFPVAGREEIERWTFTVAGPAKIRSPLGEFDTVQVRKTAADDAGRQAIDIWLAPSLEWYPVRVRYTESDGDLIEQSLTGISRKPG
jgi:hypothetical protein